METASNCPSVVVTYGSGKHSKTARGRTMSEAGFTVVGNCACNIHTYNWPSQTQLRLKEIFLKDNFCNGIAVSRWDYAKG